MESRRDRSSAPRRELEPVARSPRSAGHEAGRTRALFCTHLIGAREHSGKSLDEIASVTRIPMRSLERLEAGEFEKLPADVFVRGFLRSYARCVGLDEEDTLRRYGQCGMAPAPVAAEAAGPAQPQVAEAAEPPAPRRTRLSTLWSRDTAEAGSDAAPRSAGAAERVPRVVPAEGSTRVKEQRAAPRAAAASKKRRRRRRKRKADAGATAVRMDGAAAIALVDEAESPAPSLPVAEEEREAAWDWTDDELAAEPEASAPDGEAAPSEPVAQRLAETGSGRHALPVPMLLIDDDDPEEAERIREERSAREEAAWRHFLPPALLDSQEGSRRSALTLAVIILVIVATLTMSYLMRRPSDSGDGVTQRGPGGIQMGEAAGDAGRLAS